MVPWIKGGYLATRGARYDSLSTLVDAGIGFMIGLVLFFPQSVATEAMQVMAAEAAALVVVEVLAIAFTNQAADESE